ncbi:MAG: thioredoxin family protein [Peptoniphilaceae bacterium]|nr:thioredoxin family protein [Peptoniphilaceae bacterium]MDY6018845.1 thioredoxin family protein [Anaerococcus sp.]
MKKRNIIILLSVVFVLAFAIISTKISEKNEKEEEIRNYEASVSNYEKITDKDMLNEDKSLEGFVYIGRKTCPACRLFVKVITSVALENDISIKYFDTDKYRETKDYQNILDKYEIERVPELILVKKDGSFEKFTKDNIKDGEIFKDWIVKNKESKL